MADTVIRVENLSKQYRLGAINHGTLRADLASWWARLRGQEDPNLRIGSARQPEDTAGSPDRFWALKDINFEVKQGEILGIIGKNGAGKSTLLKILSRVTTPTCGQIKVRGRIASLLEVGTGFHPELSGRENIFLNGAILGMRKDEIRRKLDEIIAFAEVEKFIDTPVKRYSSGMYVRLAFAVAAHLEPEILVVDEVLAVGDAEFQKKCLGKMEDVAKHGRTVLFVSHNMTAIAALCKRGIVLDHGKVEIDEGADVAVRHYLSKAPMMHAGMLDLRSNPFRRRGSKTILSSVVLRGRDGASTATSRCGEGLTIDIVLASGVKLKQPQFGIGFDDALGNRVFSVATYFSNSSLPDSAGGEIIRCEIESLDLSPGIYTLSLSAGNAYEPLLDALDHAIAFEVVGGDYYGTGRVPDRNSGIILKRSRWSQANA